MPDTTPTLTGFQTFAQNVAGINTTVMPTNDPGWATAFAFALEWIPTWASNASAVLYTAAVYNWGVSELIQYQQDQSGQVFFQAARKQFGVNNFEAGVVDEASDTGTSEHLAVGRGLKNMDMISLQRIKDPFGRQAVAILQSLGTLWGLT